MEENKLSIQNEISNEEITNLIYTIRGKQVMLDSDVAMLYHYSTKRINETVNRNKQRFPENFCFQLTDEEYEVLRCKDITLNKDSIQENFDNSLRSQFATLNENIGRGKHRKYLPYVFTEQGVAMLATILKSKIAAQVSIAIMDAFVAMRKYISSNLIEQKYINNLVLEDHEKIKVLESSFEKLEEKQKTSEIYFNGQIYDAYSKILDIFKSAKEELIIIDSYANKSLLDIIKSLSIKVTIITKENNLLTKQDIEKYNKQYHNLNFS